MNKSIAIITYSTVTFDSNNQMYVNRAIGKLLDDLSAKYNKIYYVASRADLDSSLYDSQGKSIYNYRVKSNKVKFIFVNNIISYSMIGRISGMFNNLFFLIKKLKNIDYYYLNLPSFSNAIFALYLLFKKKYVISYIGSNWDDTGPLRLQKKLNNFIARFAFKIYTMIQNYIIKKSHFILVTGNYLFKKYSSINDRIELTVPMTSFAKINLDKKENICHKSYKILYVGRISYEKGFDLLVDVMNSLGSEFSLDAIGPIDKLMKEKVGELKNNDNINIVGYINNPDQLKEYFKKANLFIFLTKGEGFPRVIYEAMLSGLPVITSNLDTIKVSLGENRALYVENNVEEIVNSIKKIFSDKKLYKRLQNEGVQFTNNIFNQTAADQLNHLINKY